MKYDVTKHKSPAMPKLGKGTECLQILLSQVSKSMHEPLVPMLFPSLGARMSGAEFQYPDQTWKETCGLMANLVAESGGNKGQLSYLVEAICRSMRSHDEDELKKLVEWQKLVKTRGANKEKPARPEVAFWFPPADVTNAAFIQNAMGCENLGERTQYLNLPEVEMADRICGGHKQISQMLRNIYSGQASGRTGECGLLDSASPSHRAHPQRHCLRLSAQSALSKGHPPESPMSRATAHATAPSASHDTPRHPSMLSPIPAIAIYRALPYCAK